MLARDVADGQSWGGQKAKAKQGRKVEGESLETMHVLGGGNKGWPLKAKKLYSMWQQERKEENEAEFQM